MNQKDRLKEFVKQLFDNPVNDGQRLILFGTDENDPDRPKEGVNELACQNHSPQACKINGSQCQNFGVCGSTVNSVRCASYEKPNFNYTQGCIG